MRLVIRQSKLSACLAEVQLAHQNTLWHLSHSLVKMTDKMDEIWFNRKFWAQEPSEWRDFSIRVSNLTVFQPRIYTDSSSVGRSNQVVLKLIRSNWSLRVFFKPFSIKIVKYEDGMLILGQNKIFCGHNVVNFSVWFLQLTVFKYLVASHVTEQGLLLIEPGAVIKFSHFCSHPGTCML